MKFSEVVAQTLDWLQREGRVSYRALKREFELDDNYIEDLKAEIVQAKRLAVDEDGVVLVWIGAAVKQETENRGNGESGKKAEDRPSFQTLDAAAERRQLTVQFIDLVGSTALSTQLDPEELREVIQAYRETCATVIRRFDGHLAKYIGDGLLVYFGYPTAHEDDAQRAVRTALGIVAAIQQLSFPTIQLPRPLQVRIGIHTGLVVAGEMGTVDQPEHLAIVGETPNIAARIQGLAEPNTVIISTAVHHLVGGQFECQPFGSHLVKGIDTPIAVYHVQSERLNVAPLAGKTTLTPLIGREHEVGLLQEWWMQAKGGAGQVVLISGEAGIGKSRLVQTLKEQVTVEGATRIEFRCSPYHQNSALYPIIDHLQRLLQFAREDSPAAKLEKLQHTLSHYRFAQANTFPLLASLLSLPHPEGAPPITLSPQKQKEKTQEALVSWVVEEAEKAVVYCSWEDLHWADPSSLEVLTLLLEQAPTSRLLALLTFRPDFTPPWRPHSHITQLTLNRLRRLHVETMVEKVAGGKALPSDVLQQIVAKTDGVPLFVEELTKMVLESGLLREEDGYYIGAHGGVPILRLAIPSTLQDSLMARLDRLGPAKEIAQVGATLGREFSYELLHAVSSLDEGSLRQGLRQLVEAELIYQRGLPPQATYLFKHALVQDTAYQSLLKSTRQQSHRRIAQVLAERFPETVETQPELVAHHYTEAGMIEQALLYWRQAGERATQRSAYVEAISHLTRGLEALKALPDTPERVQQELTLQLALSDALQPVRGHAAPEVGKTYTRARELCQQLGETPQLLPVLFRLFVFYFNRAELQTARALAEQLMRLAQSVHDRSLLSLAHMPLGCTSYWLGDLVSARTHFEQAIALYDPQQHLRSTVAMYFDPRWLCRSYVALTLWGLGYPAQGLKRSDEAVALAGGLSHPLSLAETLFFAAKFHSLCREEQGARERAEAVMTLATEQEFPYFLTTGMMVRGWALAAQGQVEEGIAGLQQGLTAWQATGAKLGKSHYLALLAEAYGKAGQREEGLNIVAEALVLVDNTGERVYEAELYRLKGQLTLQSTTSLGQVSDKSRTSQEQSSEFTNPQSLTPNPQSEAEACFLKAIEIARKQQAKFLELRAAMSLARLWQSQGKKEEAQQMLAEIYNWFTEGFDTKDLQEAKALLESLSS